MSEERQTPHGPSDDDALAAEYVLGVLADEERRGAARRIEREPTFARRVTLWQQRFAELDDAFVPVAPPHTLKAAIDARVFASPPAPAASPAAPRMPSQHGKHRRAPTPRVPIRPARPEPRGLAALWRNLAVWRLATAVASAACAVLVALMLITPTEVGLTPTLIASLNPQDGTLQFVAVYDNRSHLLRVAHTAGEAPPDHALELWLVPADADPISLGLIDASGGAAALIDAALADRVNGAVIAVSLEPPGGSPSGAPTGPVVAAGPTRAL